MEMADSVWEERMRKQVSINPKDPSSLVDYSGRFAKDALNELQSYLEWDMRRIEPHLAKSQRRFRSAFHVPLRVFSLDHQLCVVNQIAELLGLIQEKSVSEHQKMMISRDNLMEMFDDVTKPIPTSMSITDAILYMTNSSHRASAIKFFWELMTISAYCRGRGKSIIFGSWAKPQNPFAELMKKKSYPPKETAEFIAPQPPIENPYKRSQPTPSHPKKSQKSGVLVRDLPMNNSLSNRAESLSISQPSNSGGAESKIPPEPSFTSPSTVCVFTRLSLDASFYCVYLLRSLKVTTKIRASMDKINVTFSGVEPEEWSRDEVLFPPKTIETIPMRLDYEGDRFLLFAFKFTSKEKEEPKSSRSESPVTDPDHLRKIPEEKKQEELK
eukprot:TRINITY_DN4602_c0_g3_i2.p1 TRINITY_DN4602_c0_g3~~TRINITY_DN4602_c0_g3_i2.p1  ORF type:complete len:384 (-),score=91.59 TRINITY_DN4602_c0_g3_i2:28-1179(-)